MSYIFGVFLLVICKTTAAPTKIEAAFVRYPLIFSRKALQSCLSSEHYLPENDFLGSCLTVVHLPRPLKAVFSLELLGDAFCSGEGFCQLADTLFGFCINIGKVFIQFAGGEQGGIGTTAMIL